MVQRKRRLVSITLDPDWKEKAVALAETRGMTLSRYLETLVREDLARQAQKKSAA